jgi:hypothetical protein
MFKLSHNKGSAMLEIVIATSIFLGVVVSLVGVFNLALKSALANAAKIEASFLEEEGIEAVLTIRDASWSANIVNKVSGTDYYLTFNGTNWTIGTTRVLVDNVFERKINFYDVYRDSSQNIVSSGGTLDLNTKKVVSTVSWQVSGATVSRSMSTYLTNIFNY